MGQMKFCIEFMNIQFSKQSEQLLEEHQVTREKYIAWVVIRFRERAFLAGATVSFVFFILMLIIAFSSTSSADDHSGVFWFIIIIDIFLTLIFFSVAVSMKHGTAPVHVSDGKDIGKGFRTLDLQRSTSTDFMKNISEKEWLSIAAFDSALFYREEVKRTEEADYSKLLIKKLHNLRQKAKKAGFLSLLGIALLTAAVILLPALSLSPGSPTRLPLLVIYLFLYCIAAAGLNGWVFIYALIGLYTREIGVPGEYESNDLIYRRMGAVIWSYAIMIMTAILFIAFMIIPAAFLL
jgi:hypothetical protein